MRTITARYSSTCPTCAEPIEAGALIDYHGRGHATHHGCAPAEGMPTTRERREARAERLRGWADTRDAKAAQLHAQNEPYRGDHAFNTQPGHIPERARAIARTERAWEHSRKADEMGRRADTIDAQNAGAIYDDDPDALERLAAKLERLEAERARIVAYNKTARAGAPDLELLDERQRAALASSARHSPAYHERKRGQMPSYALSNLTGTINTTRQRLARLARNKERTA